MILFVSGATGGHLYPAIALTQLLKQPSFFIVSRQYPAMHILKSHQLPFYVKPITKKAYFIFPITILKILAVFIQKKPKVLLCMGGGICVPYAIVAWLLKIPIISLEQNAIPGRATRVIQFLSKHVITTFKSTQSRLAKTSNVICLGNPIRISYPSDSHNLDILSQLSGKTILVVGGSQGAEKINEFINENKVSLLLASWNIIHLTGPSYFNKTFGDQVYYKDSCEGSDKQYVAIPYLTNMGAAYEQATVVISRSGATTLSEIKAYGLPSILIPYPFAKDNHQMVNALEFSKEMSQSWIVRESQLDLSCVKEYLEKVANNRLNQQRQDINNNKKDMISSAESICEYIKNYLK